MRSLHQITPPAFHDYGQLDHGVNWGLAIECLTNPTKGRPKLESIAKQIKATRLHLIGVRVTGSPPNEEFRAPLLAMLRAYLTDNELAECKITIRRPTVKKQLNPAAQKVDRTLDTNWKLLMRMLRDLHDSTAGLSKAVDISRCSCRRIISGEIASPNKENGYKILVLARRLLTLEQCRECLAPELGEISK